MNEVLRKYVVSGSIEVVRLLKVQVVGEDLQHVCAALDDVIRQKLNSVRAHQSEKGVVLLFEVGLSKLEFDRSEFAQQDPDEEVPATTRRLQKARVNALGLALDEVEHRLDHPRGGEHLSVVGNTFFGLDQAHGANVIGREGGQVWLQRSSGRNLRCVEAEGNTDSCVQREADRQPQSGRVHCSFYASSHRAFQRRGSRY